MFDSLISFKLSYHSSFQLDNHDENDVITIFPYLKIEVFQRHIKPSDI